MDTWFYRIIKPLLNFLIWILYHPKVVGRENIPKKGPVVFAGNHTRWSDPPTLCAIIHGRQIHFLAKIELFKKGGLTTMITKGMGSIPVDRKIHDKGALDNAINALKKGLSIGVFPEGTTMKVSQITASEAEDIAKEELWDAVKSAIWVDISFRDIEWNEIEPRNAQDVHVSVSLINRPFVRDMEDANLTIVHQDNDGNTQSIENVDVDKWYSKATAEFDHNHFSIFVIAIVEW